MNDIDQIKIIEIKLRLVKLVNTLIAFAMLITLIISMIYFAINLKSDFVELQSLFMRMAGLTSIILGLIFVQGIIADIFVKFYKDFADTYGIRNRQAHVTKNIVRIYRSFLNSGGPFFQGRELYAGIFSISIMTTSLFLLSAGTLWLWIHYALIL